MLGKYLIVKSVVIISILILAALSGCLVKETDSVSAKSVSAKGPDINTKAAENRANITNDTVFPSPVSNLQSTRGSNWINWTWENPGDKDFSYAKVYIDGKFKVNVSRPKNYYNLTRLQPEKLYSIGIHTADLSDNINPYQVNGSTSTESKFVDRVPPDKIWYLEATAGKTWINWTWENPADKDLKHVMVYIDGKFKVNVTKQKSYYNLTRLSPNMTKAISARTVDSNKNINLIWVNNTATTLYTPLGAVTNLEAAVGRTWINWTWENPEDGDFSHVMVYIDGTFKVNLNKPKNYYNLTKLINGTSHTISLATVDKYNNINTNFVGNGRTTLD